MDELKLVNTWQWIEDQLTDIHASYPGKILSHKTIAKELQRRIELLESGKSEIRPIGEEQ